MDRLKETSLKPNSVREEAAKLIVKETLVERLADLGQQNTTSPDSTTVISACRINLMTRMSITREQAESVLVDLLSQATRNTAETNPINQQKEPINIALQGGSPSFTGCSINTLQQLLVYVSMPEPKQREASEVQRLLRQYYQQPNYLYIKRLFDDDLSIADCYVNLSIIEHQHQQEKEKIALKELNATSIRQTT